ncbi:MFS family permease [Arthrobacter sp. UYP6]|uniref:MFS transporter n=1 Tax=Arthrobacter sp. UYP6 TaxID=1756378 RepID=UPI0033966F2B
MQHNATRETKAEGVGPETGAGGVFSPRLRRFTIGILASVGAVAFESLGIATILPSVAEELGGLGGYGWALSALMLANIIGTVIAGTDIDRRGPARTVLFGSLVFAAGCLLAGLAPGWGIFITARALQGLGVGAIMAYAYSLVGIAYPGRLQAVMFAFLSSAWTIPSLLGPLFAGVLTSLMDWRVIFWAIAPVTLLLLPLVLPSARRLSHPRTRARRGIPAPVWFSILLAMGTGAVLFGLEVDVMPLLIILCLGGLAGGVLALRRIVPTGTLGARRGTPAGIVIRFLLCGVYFGSEAFLPLGLTRVHGLDVTFAGLALASGALAWTAGSFVQARIDMARPGTRSRSTRIGFLALLVGEIVMGAAVAFPGLWPGWAVVGWTVAGIGMGVAFNAATAATVTSTPTNSAGSISASLQLAQTLSTAIIAGIGGAAIAKLGPTTPAFLAVFGLTAALGILGTLLAGRLDETPGDRTSKHPVKAAQFRARGSGPEQQGPVT